MYIFPFSGKRLKTNIEKTIENDSIIALSFGTSHAEALNFEMLNLRCGEFGGGGAGDFSEIKYLLEYLLPKMKNIRYCFISLSYFQPYINNNFASGGDMADTRIGIYFAIPQFSMIQKEDINNFLAGKLAPYIAEKEILANYVTELINKLTGNQNSTIFLQKDNINSTKKWIPDSLVVKSRVKTHLLYYKSLENCSEMFNFNLQKVKEIVSLLKKRNCRVIFYTPPYYFWYTKYFPQHYIKDMENFVGKIEQIEYYNFTKDSSFIFHSEYFRDSDHLNEFGEKVFSKKLRNLLKLYFKIKSN